MTITYRVFGAKHVLELEDTDDLAQAIRSAADAIVAEQNGVDETTLRLAIVDRLLDSFVSSNDADLGELTSSSLSTGERPALGELQ